ncbi:MAG: GNAT family N-acetyltransferase [Anaerolineae bacterium]|nr:GNAT family N-acetyltransferase [Anaerolineae bacterium]
MTQGINVRAVRDEERAWVRQFVAQRWSSEAVVVHGTVYHPAALPGFVALNDGARVGLVTYHVDGDACEIVNIDSLRPGEGVGTALVDAVKAEARRQGCRRLWVITIKQTY